MGVEQIQPIERVSNLSPKQKIDKIEKSLSNIENIKKINLDTIKDATSREELKRYLLAIDIPYDADILDGAFKHLLVPVVDLIMKQYDAFTTNGISNIQTFLDEKFSFIQNVFSDKLNVREMKLRHFVDTVYGVGYSFEKTGNGYTILDPINNKKIIGLTTALSAINKDKKLVDKLDEVLVERSFTGNGLNIQEMVLILRNAGIDPENEASLDRLTPKGLAQAYLNYYAKKNNYIPIPELSDHNSITTFLEINKGKIPNERITYIKLVQSNHIGSGVDDSTGKDMDILKKVMKDFTKVTTGTGHELELLKDTRSGVSNILKEGLPGLMKYMEGPEGLIILGGLIYALFFSDMKKEAWAGILGFTGLNVLTKAFNQDNNKGVLQVAAGVIENTYKTKLPKGLKGIEEKLGIKGKNKEINTISVISSINFGVLMENTQFVNGRVEIKDFSLFTKHQKNELRKIWPNGNYELEVNNLLNIFLGKSAGFTGKHKLDQIKLEMETIFSQSKYDNPSFSLVLAEVLLWNASREETQQVSSGKSTKVVHNGKTQVPTGLKLNIVPNTKELAKYINLLNGYTGIKPVIGTLKIFIKSGKRKNVIIKGLQNISGLKPANQIIITNLIDEIKK